MNNEMILSGIGLMLVLATPNAVADDHLSTKQLQNMDLYRVVMPASEHTNVKTMGFGKMAFQIDWKEGVFTARKVDSADADAATHAYASILEVERAVSDFFVHTNVK